MMLPYTPKFYANGTIFDSVGNTTQTYVDVAWENNIICYLRDTSGRVDVLDTITEQSYTMQLTGSKFNSLVVINGIPHGFRGHDARLYGDDKVLYVENDKALIQESIDNTNSVILLSSTSNIRDFIINDDLSYSVIHSHNKITKYTKQRQKLYTTQISASASALSAMMSVAEQPELLSLDIVREYTNVGLKQYPIVLGRISSGQLFLAKVDDSTGDLHSAKMIPASGEYVGKSSSKHVNYNLTNYHQLRRMYPDDNKTLTFKLTLKNIYNNRTITAVNIPVDTSKFTSGSHHFVFRLNTMHGMVDLFVDGRLYKSVNYGASDFVFQDIAYDNMCVGATYFYNNIPLFKKLKQLNYYMVDNCAIQQFKVYDKALTNDQITVLHRNNIEMQDLITSLPCGQRNEIDQIERVFSFNVPGSKSNSVNVIIKDSDINNTQVQQQVKQLVTSRLQKVLPITTRINDIIFKNNSNTFNVRLSS